MKDGASGALASLNDSSITDPVAAAETARLRYVSDTQAGIKRKSIKRGFVYLGPDGRPIRDQEDLKRIKALAIPPAWTDVWICAKANGHLQATGRDARGRKQYRYHSRWREVRDETKYERMIAFAHALPAIRRQVEQDLKLAGEPRAKILATVVKLLESTHIRVGNEEYARSNKSFGLATLRNRHVKVNGPHIRFEFRGKSRVEHAIDLHDRRLARIIKRCQDLPGYELFQYVDENGALVAIEASDVNEYLKGLAGAEFSTKDFRTWAGTVMAARELRNCGACGSQAQSKRNLVQAIVTVAQALGNTKAVCRKCYIHPAVIDAYLSGHFDGFADAQPAEVSEGLNADEAAVLALLQRPAVASEGQPSLRKKLSRSIARLSKRQRTRQKFVRSPAPLRRRN
jgi:DNA topoisomerase I